MGRKPRGLYRQATSPWAVAPGGCTPGVKELALKGTGAARGKPPRSQAWLRTHMVSQRSDERPTGNTAQVSRPCPMGQRPHPMGITPQGGTEDGEKRIPSQRIPEVNLTNPLVGRDSAESGWGQHKSRPTCFRSVRHGERGRPMRGGVQSPNEAHGRRRRHRYSEDGKAVYKGKGARGLTLPRSNSCSGLDEFRVNPWGGGSERDGDDKLSGNAGGGRPIPGEPGARKRARRVRKGEWGNTVWLCALLLPYSASATVMWKSSCSPVVLL
jgi:hypothetical protein